MTAEEEEECAAFGAAAPVSILSGGSTRSHGCAMEALATRYSAEGAERGLPTMSTALQSWSSPTSASRATSCTPEARS